ncbi:MAG: hypothetical protein IKX61_01440 [Prevotella sp.]|nr:hypothetical protein [Prevotella sp.]
MTRINSAIHPHCLTDEHLLAEHREIKRLPYCLRRALLSGSFGRIPPMFTLGRGHVTFFLDKMEFARKRYRSLYVECHLRQFNVENYEENFVYDIPSEFSRDYTPTPEERNLLINCITERIMQSNKKFWHYFGEPISKERAVSLLNT